MPRIIKDAEYALALNGVRDMQEVMLDKAVRDTENIMFRGEREIKGKE